MYHSRLAPSESSEGQAAEPAPASPEGSVRSDSAFSRRSFLIGGGISLATASSLGPLVRRAAAAGLAPAQGSLVTGISGPLAAVASGASREAMLTFDEVAATGATTVRFAINWAEVHRAEAKFDWSGYRELYEQIVFHGLRALPVLIDCPLWPGREQSRQTTAGLRYPVGPKALRALEDFVVQVFAYFSAMGDHIDAIEIWNEPNDPKGAYISDPAAFGRMVDAAASGVEALASSPYVARRLLTIAGGLRTSADASNWRSYLAAVDRQPGTFAVGLHGAASEEASSSNPSEYARQASAYVDSLIKEALAVTSRTCWITDLTVAGDSPAGEVGQAESLGAINDTLAAHSRCNAMVVGGFTFARFPGVRQSSGAGQRPLLGDDQTPRRGLAALAAAWQS